MYYILNWRFRAYRLFSASLERYHILFSDRVCFGFSFSGFELEEVAFVGWDGFGDDVEGVAHGFCFDFEHAGEEILILLGDLVVEDCIDGGIHLWYLLSLLEREKEGFHGSSILIPGRIFLRLCTCFW